MFSARKRLISAALTCAGITLVLPVAAQAGVVIKSSGPSASQYPVGKALNDTGTVTLKKGDSITILANGGTKVINGPGTYRVAARGSSKRSTFAALTRQRSRAQVRTGATRGVRLSNPNIWMVDVSRAGTMCLSDFSDVQMWRPGYDQAATYVLARASSADHVHVTFEAEEMIAGWDSTRMPLSEGARFDITGPGGGDPVEVTFTRLEDVPNTPESLAEALLAKGCTGQLDLLAETMM